MSGNQRKQKQTQQTFTIQIDLSNSKQTNHMNKRDVACNQHYWICNAIQFAYISQRFSTIFRYLFRVLVLWVFATGIFGVNRLFIISHPKLFPMKRSLLFTIFVDLIFRMEQNCCQNVFRWKKCIARFDTRMSISRVNNFG